MMFLAYVISVALPVLMVAGLAVVLWRRRRNAGHG